MSSQLDAWQPTRTAHGHEITHAFLELRLGAAGNPGAGGGAGLGRHCHCDADLAQPGPGRRVCWGGVLQVPYSMLEAFNGATLREVTIQVGHPEDFPSHQVHGPGSGGSGSGPGSGSAFVAPLVALWRAHEQSPDRGHPRGHGHRAYFDVRTTAWNLQVHALDLVGGKATTCACWNNTRHVILGVGGQENAFYVYDSAGSVVTLSCAREKDSLLIQVPCTVADCTAVHFLPGIGVLCHFPEGDKVVLFFEGRIPHCKSLSRVAWLQACAV